MTKTGISLLERVEPLKERGLITEEEFKECKDLIMPRLREHEENGDNKKYGESLKYTKPCDIRD